MIEPLTDATSLRAIAEIAMLGAVGGALGCWIVLYGLSYSAESLSHSIFPGLVLAALAGAPILIGGAAGILVAALGIALASRIPVVERDVAVGVVVTVSFGSGVLLALSPDSPPGIGELLFGDILGVTDTELALAAGLVGVTAVILRVMHGRLLAVGFDRTSAKSVGASPAISDAVVLSLLAIAILVAVQGLGNLLVVAVLVAPAATARLLTRRAVPMMAAGSAIGVLGGVAGVYASYHLETAAGASIALTLVAVHLVVAITVGIGRLAGARA